MKKPKNWKGPVVSLYLMFLVSFVMLVSYAMGIYFFFLSHFGSAVLLFQASKAKACYPWDSKKVAEYIEEDSFRLARAAIDNSFRASQDADTDNVFRIHGDRTIH